MLIGRTQHELVLSPWKHETYLKYQWSLKVMGCCIQILQHPWDISFLLYMLTFLTHAEHETVVLHYSALQLWWVGSSTQPWYCKWFGLSKITDNSKYHWSILRCLITLVKRCRKSKPIYIIIFIIWTERDHPPINFSAGILFFSQR